MMKKIIFGVLFAIFFLYAQEVETKPRELYLKYVSYPKIVYDKQRFSVELEAIVLTDKSHFNLLTTKYTNEKNIQIISKNVIWEDIGNNKYKAKIDYKVTNKDFVLPTITLGLKLDDEYNYFENDEYDSISIKPPKINYANIAINQINFSNVIATNLKIKNVTTKQYNNTELLVVVNIEATNSNLEDFRLKQFEKQGINSFDDNYPIQNIFYYLIVPSHINTINFSYFNPTINDFVYVKLPVMLEKNLISTQTNLNPNNKSMIRYKQIIVLSFLILLIVIYLINQKKLVLFLILIMMYIAINLFLPNEKIVLNKETKVYILPTNLSTIYKILDKEEEVEILMKKEKFIKILFKNKNVGWVKKTDV